MGDLSDFERGQIIGVCLTGASVTKTATLLGPWRAVSKVLVEYMNRGKTTSDRRNSGQKLTLTEIDHTLRRHVLKYHSTTAAQVTGQ
jgi:hypothetical protein